MRIVALSEFCFWTLRIERNEPRSKQLWKLMGFLTRYAHQSLDTLMRTSIVDLMSLSVSVGDIMREEADAIKSGNDID